MGLRTGFAFRLLPVPAHCFFVTFNLRVFLVLADSVGIYSHETSLFHFGVLVDLSVPKMMH